VSAPSLSLFCFSLPLSLPVKVSPLSSPTTDDIDVRQATPTRGRRTWQQGGEAQRPGGVPANAGEAVGAVQPSTAWEVAAGSQSTGSQKDGSAKGEDP